MPAPKIFININERRALPIRAIPYVTGFQFSPCDVASLLGRPESHSSSTVSAISAYAYPFQPGSRPVHPAQFNVVLRALEDASDSPLEQQLQLLPAGIFVFEDDFRSSYEAMAAEVDRHGDAGAEHWAYLETPLLRTEQAAIILDGFSCASSTPSVRKNSREHRQSAIEHYLRIIEDCADAYSIPFSRTAIHETKADFAELLTLAGCSAVRGISLSTLDQYFSELGCRFNPGTRTGILGDQAQKLRANLGEYLESKNTPHSPNT